MYILSHSNIVFIALSSLSMSLVLISIDLIFQPSAGIPAFTGPIFRGWLGSVLRCERSACRFDCPDVRQCPYRRIFKNKEVDINPYALLSFHDSGGVKGFLKVYGDRKQYVPEILSRLQISKNVNHFGGNTSRIAGLSVKTVKIPPFLLGDQTTIYFLTPLNLTLNGRMEIIPSFSSLLVASNRAFNRVTKYFDPSFYPCHIPATVLKQDVPILDFDTKIVEIVHYSRKKTLKFSGITGWITYDTSMITPEVGHLLKAGEYLQIGKHTTYGFGGIIVASGSV